MKICNIPQPTKGTRSTEVNGTSGAPLASGCQAASHKKSRSNAFQRQWETLTPGRSRLLKCNLFFSAFFSLQMYFPLSAREW